VIGDIGCAAFTDAQRCLNFVVQTVHVIGKNQISLNQVLDVANGTQQGATVVMRCCHRSQIMHGSIRSQTHKRGAAEAVFAM